MAATAVPYPQIDPNDPRLTEPTIRFVIPFRRQIADHLPAEHASRGNRLCLCMAVWRWFHDGDHFWPQPSSACDLTVMCPGCAKHQWRENMIHYLPLQEKVDLAGGFTRLSFPTDLSNPKQAYTSFRRRLRKLLGYSTPALIKLRPVQETIEVLAIADLPSATLQAIFAAFPSMRFHRHAPNDFRNQLENILSPDILQYPDKDADLADLEVMELAIRIAELDTKYKGIRLLSIVGLTQEERKKLSTKEPSDIVGNFHQDSTHPCRECGKPALIKIPCCPKCRKVATRFTKYGREAEPPTDPSAWTEVDLYVPASDPPAEPVHVH